MKMNRKTLLALAIAGAFGLSAFASYAEDDKKETEKPQLVASGDEAFPIQTQIPELIAEDDKKDAPKPELIAEDDKKDAPKPELIAESDSAFPIQTQIPELAA
jgi:hypothetical protein